LRTALGVARGAEPKPATFAGIEGLTLVKRALLSNTFGGLFGYGKYRFGARNVIRNVRIGVQHEFVSVRCGRRRWA
jgi:hypothetical protein